MEIVPDRKRPDWYRVPLVVAEPVWGLPGYRHEDGHPIVHRSMLPLIDHPDVALHLWAAGAGVEFNAWAERDAFTLPKGFKLRTTQQQAIDFIAPRAGTLLGDSPRLGKTLSALMAHDPARGPLVVVAPLSTRAVWLGWMRRVFADLVGADGEGISVLSGRIFDRSKIEGRPIVFAHYDIIARWQNPTPIGTIVFDEAHLITNPDAQRSRAATLLARFSEKVIAMTGTPIWDLPPDLWHVIGLVAPGAWGSFHEFARRYGNPMTTAYGTRYTGISNADELRARLSEIMLRRRWIDVAEDLPPISRSVLVAEVDPKSRRRLDIIAASLKSERTNTAGNLATYRREVTTVKIQTVVAEAKRLMAAGESVVIWTWHREAAEMIGKAITASFVIHGDIAPDARDARMNAWRMYGVPCALVATMAVAQVGIDLSYARHAIFAEIDYTPAVIEQAEMRTFAPERPMAVTFVVANHLVDQRIVRALVAKLGAANPLGVGAAVDSIDALRDAVLGPTEEGDLDRFLEDMLASL